MRELLEQILAELRVLTAGMDRATELINAETAARYCGMSEKTLCKYIDAEAGPAFYDLPKGRMFRRVDLDSWLAAKFRKHLVWEKKLRTVA